MTERDQRPLNEQASGLSRLLADSNLEVHTARGPMADEPKNKIEEAQQMKIEINHRPTNYRKRNFAQQNR